jgi:hypothetical protein
VAQEQELLDAKVIHQAKLAVRKGTPRVTDRNRAPDSPPFAFRWSTVMQRNSSLKISTDSNTAFGQLLTGNSGRHLVEPAVGGPFWPPHNGFGRRPASCGPDLRYADGITVPSASDGARTM